MDETCFYVVDIYLTVCLHFAVSMCRFDNFFSKEKVADSLERICTISHATNGKKMEVRSIKALLLSEEHVFLFSSATTSLHFGLERKA